MNHGRLAGALILLDKTKNIKTDMKYLFSAIVFFATLGSYAQTNNLDISKTFVIHCKNQADVAKYYNAAIKTNEHPDGDLDMYRFYDKRRNIEFTGTSDYIELLSAKELNEKYGKPISPLTIRVGQSYNNITFAINLDGKGFKPQFK